MEGGNSRASTWRAALPSVNHAIAIVSAAFAEAADITGNVGARQTTCGTCHTLTRVRGPPQEPCFPPPRPTRPLALLHYGADQGIPNLFSKMAKVAGMGGGGLDTATSST